MSSEFIQPAQPLFQGHGAALNAAGPITITDPILAVSLYSRLIGTSPPAFATLQAAWAWVYSYLSEVGVVNPADTLLLVWELHTADHPAGQTQLVDPTALADFIPGSQETLDSVAGPVVFPTAAGVFGGHTGQTPVPSSTPVYETIWLVHSPGVGFSVTIANLLFQLSGTLVI